MPALSLYEVSGRLPGSLLFYMMRHRFAGLYDAAQMLAHLPAYKRGETSWYMYI